jgi:hypothetical protein
MPVAIRVGSGDSEATLYDRRIDLIGDRLTAFGRASGDMTEPLTTVGETLHDMILGQFTSQGGTGLTGRWQPLSEAYAAWKDSKHPGLPILTGVRPTGWVGHAGDPAGEQRNTSQTYEESGAMRLSLLDPAATHVTPKRLLYSPTSDIAGWHQTGTETMPARPPVDLRPTDLRVFDRTFAGWLADLVKRSDLA